MGQNNLGALINPYLTSQIEVKATMGDRQWTADYEQAKELANDTLSLIQVRCLAWEIPELPPHPLIPF